MIIKTNVLSPVSREETKFLKDVFLKIEGTKIIDISSQEPQEAWQDRSDCLCLPGLIDLHTHLPQFLVRGRHSPALLNWLNDYIFSEEAKFASPAYARQVSELFFRELITRGTTLAVIYTSVHKEACEIAFSTARSMGLRVIMGKTMMDTNCPASLKEDGKTSFREAVELYEKWHHPAALTEYVFSPRFAPVCSSELMYKIGKFIATHDVYLQTHLAENLGEIEWVKSLFPTCSSYTEVYEKHGLLGKKTLLGHCIHLEQSEREILKKYESVAVYCPDSNFFLRSGEMNVTQLLKTGIRVGLASDVGAGTSVSMFQMMKMALYRQESYQLSPQFAFWSATLGAAAALGKSELLGSIAIGKEADLIFIKEDCNKNTLDLVSELVYFGWEKKIEEVYVAGKKIR